MNYASQAKATIQWSRSQIPEISRPGTWIPGKCGPESSFRRFNQQESRFQRHGPESRLAATRVTYTTFPEIHGNKTPKNVLLISVCSEMYPEFQPLAETILATAVMFAWQPAARIWHTAFYHNYGRLRIGKHASEIGVPTIAPTIHFHFKPYGMRRVTCARLPFW